MIPDRFWILIGKKKAKEASEEELKELNQLLIAHSLDGYTTEIIDSLWASRLKSVPENQLGESNWKRIEEQTLLLPAGKRSVIARISSWVAAAAILIVASVLTIFFLSRSTEKKHIAAAENQNMNHVATRVGSKSKLELPDGTQVWLNGDSKIAYTNGDFGKTNREIVLTGEAFFDVVRNENVPFIIHTGPVNITVKGTAFNVKAYPKDETIETALVRGLVEITTTGDPDRKIMLKPNEKIIIPVTHHVTKSPVSEKDSSQGPLYSITKMGTPGVPPSEIAWIDNQLVFDDEPFETIAPKMESWYHIRIHFTDENLKKRRFSGVIEKETIRETLEAMQLSNHFNYTIRENELWVGNNH